MSELSEEEIQKIIGDPNKPPTREAYTLFIHARMTAPIDIPKDDLYQIIEDALKEKGIRFGGTFDIKDR